MPAVALPSPFSPQLSLLQQSSNTSKTKTFCVGLEVARRAQRREQRAEHLGTQGARCTRRIQY
eukprot:1109626-Rhodomonas_salina.1